ncbi:MAG: hypothetical protein ABFD25_00930 [Clostridiaceae bacterium]
MNDSIDEKKAGILKDVHTGYSDSTSNDSPYAHKGSTTVNSGGPWQYADTPEFKEPVIINSPRYSPAPINPADASIDRCTSNILQTEYSEHFDMLRKNRMVVSFHKYGPVKINYGEKLVSAINNLEKRLELYKQTGNTEYLCDIANFAMIEFMHPQHPDAHFNDMSESPGLGGMTYREIEQL